MSIDMTPGQLTSIDPELLEQDLLLELDPAPARRAGRIDRVLDRVLRSRALWLVPVLFVQGVLSLRPSNTLADDEATSINAGHQLIAHLLHGTPTPDFGRSFSGVPAVYSIPAALLADVGGVTLVRLASAAMALIATAFVYFATRRLFGQGAALVAAALLGLNTLTLFTAQFAGPDALCLALLAAGSWLAVTAGYRPRRAIALGPCLVLAAAASYLALPFVPAVVVLLGLQSARSAGTDRALRRVALALGSLAVSAAVGAVAIAHSDLTGLHGSLLARPKMTATATAALHHQLWTDIGPLLVVAAAGVVLAAGNRLIAGLLVLTALVAVSAQTYLGSADPAHDISALALVFLAPVAGLTGMVLLRRGRLLGIRAPLAVGGMVVLLAAGVGGSSQLLHAWPSSTRLDAALAPNVHRGAERYLVAGGSVPAYYLSGETSYGQWVDSSSPQYASPSAQRQLRREISQGRFAIVAYHTDRTTPGLDQSMRAAMQDHYTLMANLPITPDGAKGHWYLWHKETAG